MLIVLLILYIKQTLSTLNLEKNKIGNQGAQHLINALQKNRVKFSICYSICHSLFQTDDYQNELHFQ